MNASLFFLPVFLTLFALPAQAQCGPSHHGSNQGHSGHQESAPERVHATNTICPVMGQPVKPVRDREVVIRGTYYLVCCDGCGPEMSEHYNKYLDKDGRPLNDPQRESNQAGKISEPPTTTASPSKHDGHQH